MADLVVVPRAAHLANVEQPDAVSEAILEHLDRVRERERELQR